MPSAPLRCCSVSGCSELVPRGRCAAHQKAQKQEHSRFYTGGGFYGRRWRTASRAYLARHPLCVDCGRMATDVDHQIPHRGDQVLFWDETNWRGRCQTCHSKKTAKEVGWSGTP